MAKTIVAGVLALLTIGGLAGFYLYTSYLPGTLILQVADPPGGNQNQYPSSISHIWLDYSSIDIHAAGVNSSSSGWKHLVGSGSIDLLTVLNTQRTLGTAKLPTGRYDIIRVMATTATVTISGTDHTFTIPNGRIQIVVTGGSFQIIDQQTVNILLTLSFNASEILAMGPNLTPVAMAEVTSQ